LNQYNLAYLNFVEKVVEEYSKFKGILGLWRFDAGEQ
jgi:hypothetical protein